MMIYILNLLHDNLRQNVKGNVGTAIINDATYIASFAGINRNTSTNQINSKLMNVFEIIKKYKVSAVDTLEVLEIMVGNEYNDWIIDKFYGEIENVSGDKLILPLIVNDILKDEKEVVLENMSRFSSNVRTLIRMALFNTCMENQKIKIKDKLYEVS